MAEATGIAWARSTFNPWIGCTKVGPGCDHCYAEALDVRHRWGGATHWGAGVPRYRLSEHALNDPLRWNRRAQLEQETGELTPRSTWKGRVGHWPVFCASLADVFDNEADGKWREGLWRTIELTSRLSWLLVTKRIGNVARMVPERWMTGGFPANVRVIPTIVNQEEADRDIPKLLALPCKNGISYEPALGPVDWWHIPVPGTHGDMCDLRSLGWIIVGGESSQGKGNARPFYLAWARSTVAQCKAAGVPVFVKQLGSAISVRNDSGDEWPDHDEFDDAIPDDYQPLHQGEFVDIRLKDRAGADPAEWPLDLRVQQFPLEGAR